MEQTQEKTKSNLLAFVLFKLAKNTKSLEKNVKGIDETEIPHLSLKDINNYVCNISYSYDSWFLHELQNDAINKFNPNNTELVEFSENFSFEAIEQAITDWSLHTSNVFAKYGIEIPK